MAWLQARFRSLTVSRLRRDSGARWGLVNSLCCFQGCEVLASSRKFV